MFKYEYRIAIGTNEPFEADLMADTLIEDILKIRPPADMVEVHGGLTSGHASPDVPMINADSKLPYRVSWGARRVASWSWRESPLLMILVGGALGILVLTLQLF